MRIFNFPRPKQGIIGLTRTSDPCTLEIHFAAMPTGDELINTWLHLKQFVPGEKRPNGWEPIDKDGAKWECK